MVHTGLKVGSAHIRQLHGHVPVDAGDGRAVDEQAEAALADGLDCTTAGIGRRQRVVGGHRHLTGRELHQCGEKAPRAGVPDVGHESHRHQQQ